MSIIKEKLHAAIGRLGDVELRVLEKFVADLTLEEEAIDAERAAILDRVQAENSFVPWQPL